MSKMLAPEGVPVWVNEQRCKGCDLCVSVCPAGVLGMGVRLDHVLGKVAKVAYPESCIGCCKCELGCPDFAIYVAEKKDFKFAKVSKEAEQRGIKVRANHYMLLEESVAQGRGQ
ncbi:MULTISPECIES: 4Fe-4S binding protein [Helicobacter]|uniref:4Fe-4S dicluster domain-containing protein n=2 Tax=Helicobacter TaxID=209 RepID=A0A553UX19_9HELI|nr:MULTISPECIES: 4Fe-4S binding protein [Helicobacter]TSA84752.1 4Fe-4S dicluster domain-containing protein [Helicobacter mehlei]GMB93398.1 2-oxoglutarate-acceptor oxidoreductase subunit OorD [Helicobacter bizzozeronii]CCB80860.1 2-oxoglutarate oxidoreductase, delta subunit,putative [Helicobacter bizzozeronii CIII-1]